MTWFTALLPPSLSAIASLPFVLPLPLLVTPHNHGELAVGIKPICKHAISCLVKAGCSASAASNGSEGARELYHICMHFCCPHQWVFFAAKSFHHGIKAAKCIAVPQIVPSQRWDFENFCTFAMWGFLLLSFPRDILVHEMSVHYECSFWAGTKSLGRADEEVQKVFSTACDSSAR